CALDHWHRCDLWRRRDESTRDRCGDLAGARGDDGDRNVAKKSADIIRRLVVERVGHRERRLAATERDEHYVPLLAESLRELRDDGRVDRIDEALPAASETRDTGVVVGRQRHQRTTAHA